MLSPPAVCPWIFLAASHSVADGPSSDSLFNGLIDETRYCDFNPLAAGAFSSTDFLITPEPSAIALACAAILLACRRPKPRYLLRTPPPYSL